MVVRHVAFCYAQLVATAVMCARPPAPAISIIPNKNRISSGNLRSAPNCKSFTRIDTATARLLLKTSIATPLIATAAAQEVRHAGQGATTQATRPITLGVIIGNRDFFPDVLVGEARKDLVELFEHARHPRRHAHARADEARRRRDVRRRPQVRRPVRRAPRRDRRRPRRACPTSATRRASPTRSSWRR